MRVDKWLWAARCYKTRSLASDAVDGGRIKLYGASDKPATEVKVGDRLRIRAGDEERELIVRGFNEQRRLASEAQLLCEETADSLRRRAQAAELRKLTPTPAPDHKGRPTTRDLRKLMRLWQN